MNIAKCTYTFFLKMLYNFLNNKCRTSLRSIKINIYKKTQTNVVI